MERLEVSGAVRLIYRSLGVNGLIQGSAPQIKTSTHCNLIGHSMTTPSPVLSPSNILPHLLIIVVSFYQGNIGAFKKCYYFNFVTGLKIAEIWNSVTCILRKSVRVGVIFIVFTLTPHRYFLCCFICTIVRTMVTGPKESVLLYRFLNILCA